MKCRRLMSTSRASGFLSTAVKHERTRYAMDQSTPSASSLSAFLKDGSGCGPGGALGPVYLRVPVLWARRLPPVIAGPIRDGEYKRRRRTPSPSVYPKIYCFGSSGALLWRTHGPVGWVIGARGARFNVQSVGCYGLRDCDVGHRCFGSLLRACEAADWGSMGRDGI